MILSPSGALPRIRSGGRHISLSSLYMAQHLDQDLQQSPTESENVHYTVFIRLPFPRGNFVDPPNVNLRVPRYGPMALMDIRSTGMRIKIESSQVYYRKLQPRAETLIVRPTHIQMPRASADWQFRACNVCQPKSRHSKPKGSTDSFT